MVVPHTILLVEDDSNLAYVLKEYLAMNNYLVTWAKNGVEALGLVKNSSFDLCLVDVMLPQKDGFTFVSELKQISFGQPIIFLTAKSLKVDKLKGFKLGADDYIIKPVDEEELLARIDAVINRTSKSIPEDAVVQIGSFQFDMVNLSLNSSAQTLKLSNREAQVLKLIAQTPGKLVERKKILIDLWGSNDYFNRRSMDVIISRLRKYLKSDPCVAIINVHSKGFILKSS